MRRLRKPPRALLEEHHVLVDSDGTFQARARLLQALWRESKGFPIGSTPHRPQLGSHLASPWATETLANFLSPTVREVVRRTLAERQRGSLMEEGRLMHNLLGSQPLCFNLFGELSADLDLAARVLRRLGRTDVERVHAIEMEWSPGRGDLRFTGDSSAFDVFVVYEVVGAKSGSKRAFLAFEVKYHEDLRDDPAEHKARYDEVAEAMCAFVPDRAGLRVAPLQQIWRDHLLVGSMRIAEPDSWAAGTFVFLAPRDNPQCTKAVAAYRRFLDPALPGAKTFDAWTLESFADALRAETDASWVRGLVERYLDFTPVDEAIAAWRSR